tara:strand:+ start:9007 stop:9945 length:939 start_codon:yes stop_codon:yes gene_type:complete
MSKDFLWVEKYRPQTITEAVLPKRLKDIFETIVEKGELPNMMFAGTAGLGKTTIAKAMCRQLGLDHILINGSEDGNIDTLRGKIKQFASSVSLSGGYKVVILDEADYLNAQSTQPALRGFIEEFSDNCRFILTCNKKNRIIEPLHSRCSVYEFSMARNELSEMAQQFFVQMCKILDTEGVQYDQKTVVDLVMKHAPDWRRVINEAQRYCISGTLNPANIMVGTDDNYSVLMGCLKSKDFKSMRKWVAQNSDLDTSSIFRGIYDRASAHMKPESVPQMVLIIADYQYKDAFVADHEINTVACMTEIMSSVEFK